MSISASAILGKRVSEGSSNLLKGSDLAKSVRTITVKVTDVREAPESFGSPIIIDIEPVLGGKTAWAVNKTNLRLLVEAVGDNLEVLKGCSIKLEKMLQNNPKEKKLTFGLVITSIIGYKKGKKSKRG